MFEIGEEIIYVGSEAERTSPEAMAILEKLMGCKVTWPIKDQLYVVRGYNQDRGLWLQEITHPIFKHPWFGLTEVGFDDTAFVRPTYMQEMNEGLEELKQVLELELV